MNPQRDDFFEYVSSMVDLNLPTVLCGDFNAVFNRSTDRAGSDPLDTSRDSSVSLRAIFRDCCVTDAWRYCHPSSTAFTLRKSDGSLSSRTDFIGIPLPWAPFISSCTIVPCAFSDHSLVSVDVSIPDSIQRGPGRWILNKSLLSDEAFVEIIQSFWLSWRPQKGCFPSLQKWWDVGKSRIKGLAVAYSSSKKNASLQARTLLSNLASHLKAQLDRGLVSCQNAYVSTLASLVKLDLSDAEAAIVCSKVYWAEDGEASTAYFLRLEKKRGCESWFSAIKDDHGSVATNLDGIISASLSFYTELFSRF